MTDEAISVAIDAWHDACHAGETNLQGMTRVIESLRSHGLLAAAADTNEQEAPTTCDREHRFCAKHGWECIARLRATPNINQVVAMRARLAEVMRIACDHSADEDWVQDVSCALADAAIAAL